MRGRVEAARFAEAGRWVCIAPRAPVCAEAHPASIRVSELIHGEAFHVLEDAEDWLWGWCGHDRYVGYVRADQFETSEAAATHRVVARSALRFAGAPSIKSAVLDALPMAARVEVEREEGMFLRTRDGWIHRRHLAPLEARAADPVEAALRLIGAPYLWGGRTGEGVDCSGLVQVALAMCGVDCPRDTDQQRGAVGIDVDPDEARRGDLVFFPGHVGIMASATDLLHANAYWMSTVVEPLADVVERLRPDHAQPVTAVRRL